MLAVGTAKYPGGSVKATCTLHSRRECFSNGVRGKYRQKIGIDRLCFLTANVACVFAPDVYMGISNSKAAATYVSAAYMDLT